MSQEIINRMKWYERLLAPTPDFFKKIRKFGVILTTCSVIVIAANGQFALGLPVIVDVIGKYLGYGGFIAATLSSFAVDPKKLDEKIDETCELKKQEDIANASKVDES